MKEIPCDKKCLSYPICKTLKDIYCEDLINFYKYSPLSYFLLSRIIHQQLPLLEKIHITEFFYYQISSKVRREGGKGF